MGKKGEYHFIHTNGGVIIVPLISDTCAIFVRQYRYPSDDVFLEFPAGGVKPGKSFRESALEELREETGYNAEKLDAIGNFVPYVGITDETCSIFVARKLIWNPLPCDPTEEIETVILPISDIDNILSTSCKDCKTLAAWTIARKYLLQQQ
jgi:ADP-ribose pyrophosphatase